MTYIGLCIGGPADGETRKSETKELVAIAYQRMSAVIPYFNRCDPTGPIAPSAEQRAIQVAYRFEIFQAPGGPTYDPLRSEEFGFWIVWGMSDADVMRRLVAVYAKATRLACDDLRNLLQASFQKPPGSRITVLPIDVGDGNFRPPLKPEPEKVEDPARVWPQRRELML